MWDITPLLLMSEIRQTMLECRVRLSGRVLQPLPIKRELGLEPVNDENEVDAEG